MKIALISTPDAPLLFFYLKEIVKLLPNSTSIILDSNVKPKKMKDVWHDRTNGYFEKRLHYLFKNFGHLFSKSKFYYIDNHNSKTMEQILKREKFDYLINAGTRVKISSSIIKQVKCGIINIHPGMLPKYRGCTCVEWAIYNDDPVANTIHLMDHKYDTGSIIKIEKCNIKKNMNYEDVRIMVYKKGIALLGKTLSKILSGKIKKKDFHKQNTSLGKYWKPISNGKLLKVKNKLMKNKYKNYS